MDSKINRPPSIWLTQTLLIIFALMWLGIIALNLARLPGRIGENISILRMVIGFSMMFCFVLLLLISFWGLVKRKLYGKWLGLASLIFTWGVIVYTQLFPVSGPYKRYEYDNAAQLAGAFLCMSLIHALFLILILRLAFSKKVNQFFQRGINDVRA